MITTNTHINPSTNSLLTKAIDVKTRAVNQYRHDYIIDTSKAIADEYNYSVSRASKQVQIIYDEVVKQLVIRRYSRGGKIITAVDIERNRSKHKGIHYRFAFDVRIFNNKKFMIDGKRFLYWKQMQELNSLMSIEKHGSIKFGVSLVLPNKDFQQVIRKSTTARNVVEVIETSNIAFDKIKINEPAVEDFISTSKDRVHRAVANSLLQLNKVKGYIPMQVHDSVFGRKYYKGNEYTNLQQAPSVVRDAFFQGCTEIDIDACSNSHLLGLAKKYNEPHKYLKQYKRFKQQWRLELTQYTFGDTELEHIKCIKQVLTSLGFGSKLIRITSEKHGSKIKSFAKNNLTIEQWNKLISNPDLKKYAQEIQDLLPVLVEKNQHLKKLKIDSLHINDNLKKPLKKSKVLTYMYHHFEANAMRTALKGYEKNIRLIVHDGVYLENINSKDVNSIVKRFKQMDLTCSVKQL
jgi:hypothetical protein